MLILQEALVFQHRSQSRGSLSRAKPVLLLLQGQADRDMTNVPLVLVESLLAGLMRDQPFTGLEILRELPMIQSKLHLARLDLLFHQ